VTLRVPDELELRTRDDPVAREAGARVHTTGYRDIPWAPHDHSFSSLFCSPSWLEVLERSYGFAVRAVFVSNPGPAAILYVHVDDIRGERLVSLPFSDYCDPLVDDPASWRRLTRPLLDTGLPVRLRCLRNRLPMADASFTATGRALWHGCDLTRPEDEVWGGLGGSARRNIRHARRAGVSVRVGRGIDDVRCFHTLHARLRKRKYRMLAQPRAFFENLWEAFAPSERIVVLLAELDGTPVAGILLLEWQGRLYYKFNASLELKCRPNDLLAWHAIRLGQERRLTLLDFGVSDVTQPGLIRYKRKYATLEQEVIFLDRAPVPLPCPRAAEASRMLGSVTRLLTEPTVPDEITTAAGDQLYRFFC
jgi:CelD/BcsL family acetyltransferase involved in cellulose biosynthesis